MLRKMFSPSTYVVHGPRAATVRSDGSTRAASAADHGCADKAVAALLPVVGPAFGACVLILGLWDLVAVGNQDRNSMLLRLLLVLAAVPAYARSGRTWPLAWRCLLMYAAHYTALAISAVSLSDGLRQAMPAMLTATLLAGVIEPRPMRCAWMLAPSLVFFGTAGAFALPWPISVASIGTMAFALAMAMLISAGNGSLRREALLREQELIDAFRHDSLSGALSRAYLTELAMRDLALAQRHGRPLAIAILDIDHFKRVNDVYGHAAGDAVIRAVVAACRENLRSGDYVGRVGGEEFVCVMPETQAAHAVACAQRIRCAIERMTTDGTACQVRVTVSIGVAVLCRQSDWDALLHDADMALYRAKNEGRNRTVLASSQLCAACA